MYDMLSSAFTDALKREGKTIYSYSDNTPYSVIFRKNSDKNKLVNRLSIFYPLNCGIHAGQLLNYGTKHFLTLNQETIENNVYYKSDIVETNAVINTVQDGIEVNMPVYVYDVSDALFEGNNYISYISGTFHIVAETNPTITSLKTNDTFYIIGKYVRVVNTFNKDNITNIYCQIELESNTYTVTITAKDTYHRGETVQFTATAKQNDNPVENPQITWESSDSSLATVDSTGLVTFLADGNVSITATWVTHNVSDTKAVAITEPDTYSLVVNGEDSYTTGDTPTLTATAQTNGITDDTATITWISSDSNIATIDSTGLVTFLTAGEVTFTATWVEHDITAEKAVTVTEVETYSVEIICDDTYTTDDTPTIIVVGKQNGTVVDTAVIYVTSSDPDVATIDANNKVTFLKAGTVTFTADWHDFNVKTTKTVTVTQAVVYALTFNVDDSYLLTDTPTLTAVATADGVEDTTATITWTSSDTNVATIDPNTGLVTFISAGTVIFSAHWTEHNITKASQIVTVTSGEMTCTIEGPTTIIASNTYNVFTAHFWNGSTELTDITEEWTVAIPSGYEERITYFEDAENNQIWIKADHNWTSIKDKTVDLTLKDSNHTCSTTITIAFKLPG